MHTPLYLQIQSFVRDGIRSGRFAAGERLPSEPELAKRFDTTRATVARAFLQLAFEGLVDRRIGSGTFVSQRSVGDRVDTTTFASYEEHVLARGEKLEYRLLRFKREAAKADVASQLELALSEPVFRLERLRAVGGEPIAVEVRFLPGSIGSGVKKEWLETYTVQRILQEFLGLRIATMENAVRATACAPRIATALNLARHDPVLVRSHVIRGAGGRPLLVGETFYPPQFTIRYTLQSP
jgi:GntR family transcriptional regulator